MPVLVYLQHKKARSCRPTAKQNYQITHVYTDIIADINNVI